MAKMLKVTWAMVCFLSFVLSARAELALNQMSRLESVALKRGGTEFILTIRFDPNRGLDGVKTYAVNGGTIVLVKFPKTYVDPGVRDFQLSNDWITNVSAHQFDRETVNLRIALNAGFSVDSSRIKTEVFGDSIILHMPLPTRSSDASKAAPLVLSPDISTTNNVVSDNAQPAQKNEDAVSNVNIEKSKSENSQAEVNSVQGEITQSDIKDIKEKTSEADAEPVAPPTSSAAPTISLTTSDELPISAVKPRALGISKLVAISLGLSGAILIAFGVFKKFRKSTFGSIQPRVITRCSLGFKKYLAVVEFEDARYLVAVGPHDTTLLAKLDNSGQQTGQQFETVLVKQTHSGAEISALERIRSKVAMLNPLDKQ